MKRLIERLGRDEDGAVTVDWLVLTAAMCAFGLAIGLTISKAATDPADGVGARLAAMEANP